MTLVLYAADSHPGRPHPNLPCFGSAGVPGRSDESDLMFADKSGILPRTLNLLFNIGGSCGPGQTVPNQHWQQIHFRLMTTSAPTELDESTVQTKMGEIADRFVEARELLEDAREVKDTVYFSEDMEEASKAVDETLMMYNDFLEQLTKSQRQEVLRTIGLKMQELKAQKINLEEESLQE